MKKKRIILVILVLSLIAAFTSCSGKQSGRDVSSEKEEKENKAVKVSILCAGDVMAHAPNISSALKSDGSYDFTDNYEYVEDYIKNADLALCNMETTFKGGKPQGYPLFNAPDSLAEAIYSAGFDVALTSNNHMLDTGFDGMQRTLEVLREADLKTAGSRLEGEEKGYAVVKTNGVKIGVVSYTYETTQTASTSVSINGNAISEASQKLINSFNYHDLEAEDYDRIEADIKGCRADGADVVICYMHWGNEYEQKPNQNQEEMAQELADRGADVIFASHPHVLQRIDVVTSSKGGQKVPVFYSLGNFISNQRAETLSNKYTENGAMGIVKLTILPDKDKIQAESVSVVPTWVDKYQSSGGLEYRIIPLDSKLSSNKALAESGHFSRAQAAKEYAEELFGDYIEGETIITSGGKPDGRSKGA
ncbi:MAG: CapA family protein [Lachnospiraceae bacterium]|nr:CapA family protein [Lachnospiraceae bacterium]